LGTRKTRTRLSVFALWIAATPALAQAPAAPRHPTAEILDRGLINLGLMDSILIADMGVNGAFRFASSFAAGAPHEVDRSVADRRKLLGDQGLQHR
jgi:hypothetical protein